jgi:alpha-beta hydrolase superfamily lysophospholipase
MAPGEEGRFATGDGLELWWGRWAPAGAAAPFALVNVHGLGDHSGLYPAVAQYFPARGVATWMYDARGNGRSPGRKGHVDRWETYREDLRRFIDLVRRREQLPVALLGHSLGGLMVLDYALAHPGTAGAVAAAAPPLGSIGTSPVLLALAQVMSRLWPGFRLQTGLDLTRVARDPAVREAITSDPLFHRWASARLGTETLRTRDRIQREAGALRDPVLLLHGDDDQMVSIDGSRRLAAAYPAQVTLREYPGAWHALLADHGHEERLVDLAHWLEQVMPRA